jgi:hypothetical protein
MISRRECLALLGATGIVACAAPRERPSVPVAAIALQLDPLADVVSGVGLEWLIQAKPRDLLADEALAAALESVAPPALLEKFAARYGGIDLRQAREIVVAGYPEATLGLARLSVDPVRLEAAFSQRALAVEGRASEHGVTRLWGAVDGQREQIAIFGREGVAMERGRLGPLRPAVYFAQGKLRRARPALRTDPLAAVADRIGDAPLRGFVPGPFEGAVGAGLGGLLRATTAVAGTATPAPAGQPGTPALLVRFVLGGNWGPDAPAAGERLEAAFRVLAEDPLGRLLGVDHPLEGARVSVTPDTLELDVTLDPLTLARGLRAATGASLPEILGLSAAH